MREPPCSPGWFAQARELATGLPERPGLGFGVQVVGPDGVTWHQEVRDGRVVRWDGGAHPAPAEPWASFAADERALAGFHTLDVDGTEALRGLQVLERDGARRAPSPLDITETAELQALPEVVGADL